jgi:hypothetical protein
MASVRSTSLKATWIATQIAGRFSARLGGAFCFPYLVHSVADIRQ